jgi:hypothetical protein
MYSLLNNGGRLPERQIFDPKAKSKRKFIKTHKTPKTHIKKPISSEWHKIFKAKMI